MAKPRFQHTMKGQTVYFRKRHKDEYGQPQQFRAGVSQTGKATGMSYLIWKTHFEPIKKALHFERGEGLSRSERKDFRTCRTHIWSALRWVNSHEFGFQERRAKRKLVWTCDEEGKKGHSRSCIEWRVIDRIDKKAPIQPHAPILYSQMKDDSKTFQALEKDSRALLRLAVVVYSNGWIVVPAAVRKDKSGD